MNKFIKAYLKRINYQGGIEPTLATLQALQQHHLLEVPFENLDIHLDRYITLDVEKLFDKIVHKKRGGFCYELNGLFYELLTRLGFSVKRIAANVYHTEKKEYGPDYDHLCLLVSIDHKEYLADVGFGSFTTYPLHLQTNEVQEDAQGLFLIEKISEGNYKVNKKEKQSWEPQYIFETRSRGFAEFEPMCHYHQTSPDSHFTHKRLISLMTTNGRLTLTGNVLKRQKNGRISEQDFAEEKFEYLLKKHFGVII